MKVGLAQRKRMTDQQIAKARKLHEQGFVCKKIGEMIGVPYSTTYQGLHPEARERYRLRRRKYYEEHKEETRLDYQEHKKERRLGSAQYYQEHKEKECLGSAQYRREHRGKHNAWNSARHALILGATIGNLAQIREIYERAKDDQKTRCYLCGRLIPKGHRHVDHIIPLSKGGKHTASNLAIACNSCNLSKHNKMPEEIGLLI